MAKILASAAPWLFMFNLALVFAGCSTGVSHHYLQSARAGVVAPSTLPAVNLSNGEERPLVGLRIGQAGRMRGRATTGQDTSSLHDTLAAMRNVYYAERGNYAIRPERLVIGVDFQLMANRYIDFFMTLEAAPTFEGRGSADVGAGFTLPMPWLRIRFAPALTAHRYRMGVTDSTYTYQDLYGGGTVETEEVVREERDHLGYGMGGSISAWIPETLTGIPLTPFVQLQYNALWLESSTLPSDIMGLRARSLTGGFDYRTSVGHAQVRIAREELAGMGPGWRSGYRAQTAFLFLIPE